MFRRHWLWLRQARPTNRNPRNLPQRLRADAAIVGED